MAGNKADKKINTDKLNMTQKQYSAFVNEKEPKPPVIQRTLAAFFSGGLICLLGQLLIDLYESKVGMPEAEAVSAAVATVILIGALLTGLGYFDELARWAGAGMQVPVTGFANSMVSAALEFKREGLIFGIGSHIFSLAGSVIIYGVLTAFVVGLISAIF